jgi:glycosyltransferase involved in cell wall biosynthesis
MTEFYPSARRIGMITYSFYDGDSRVRRYAQTLAERGDSVEVICLRARPDLPREGVINGVKVYRIQDRFVKNETRAFSFLWRLMRFLLASCRHLNSLHRRKPMDLVHIHNFPDLLVFASWYVKWSGTKVILDIHDIMPEFYSSKFAKPQTSIAVQVAKRFERFSAAMADHVILGNHLWLEKYAMRSARLDKCSVFINNVDERTYHRTPRSRDDGKTIVIFPGGLQWHQGVDIAIRGFDRVRQNIPEAELHIYGDGNVKGSLINLTAELGLTDVVRFFDPVASEEIAAVMAQADLGIVPKRADSFGNEAYSTKIMEFMALGVPVVVSDTKIDRYYFDDSMVRFFKSGSPDALADAMLDVLTRSELRLSMVRNAGEYAARNSWSSVKGDYLHLVDALCGDAPLSPTIPRADVGAVVGR